MDMTTAITLILMTVILGGITAFIMFGPRADD